MFHNCDNRHLSQVGRGVGDEVENKEEQDKDEETWIRSGIYMLLLDQTKRARSRRRRSRKSRRVRTRPTEPPTPAMSVSVEAANRRRSLL